MLERLRGYNRSLLTPVFGARMTTVLDGVLEERFHSAGEGLAQMREQFGDYTVALERRLLMLFALRKGQRSLASMREEAVISKQAFNQIDQIMQHAWQANLERPPLSAGGTRWARRGTLREKSAAPSAPQAPGAPDGPGSGASGEPGRSDV